MRVWHPCVIWLTGLSGAGKTTLAESLYIDLKKFNQMTVRLDGDVIRDFYKDYDFTKNGRLANIKRVADAASLIERCGATVLVSLISPYEEAREYARGLIQNFIEVYVSTPLAECRLRDPKGLYKEQLENMTGVKDPYEVPSRPDLVIDTSMKTVTSCTKNILEHCFGRFNPQPRTYPS